MMKVKSEAEYAERSVKIELCDEDVKIILPDDPHATILLHTTNGTLRKSKRATSPKRNRNGKSKMNGKSNMNGHSHNGNLNSIDESDEEYFPDGPREKNAANSKKMLPSSRALHRKRLKRRGIVTPPSEIFTPAPLPTSSSTVSSSSTLLLARQRNLSSPSQLFLARSSNPSSSMSLLTWSSNVSSPSTLFLARLINFSSSSSTSLVARSSNLSSPSLEMTEKDQDHVRKFFEAMEATVRTLEPALLIQAKEKISRIVLDLEMQSLVNNEPS